MTSLITFIFQSDFLKKEKKMFSKKYKMVFTYSLKIIFKK